MPEFGYSVKVEGPCARAYGKEIRLSPKHAIEVCRAIRGMRLATAKDYLRAVIDKKRAVPFKRHGKKLAHHKGAQGTGQYPVKAARAILRVLENAEANAKYKGLEEEKLRIVHASAQRGIIIPGYKPRAFARASAWHTPTTNVEIILKEAA